MSLAKPDSAQINSPTLYEMDYVRWIETTIAQLRRGDYSQVDWENLIDEIENMGRSERRSLKSNLIVVLLHLLKWQFQTEHRGGSWAGSIVEHRRRIHDAIADSPSLQPYLEEIFAEAYSAAVKQAKAETQLPVETFPQQSPYELTQVLDDDFWPEGGKGE